MTQQPLFSRFSSVPESQGLYNPHDERDACGLAMVATLRGTAGHDIITRALDALRNLEHRGAVGSDAGTGDGAGIVTQIPDEFFRAVSTFALPEAGRYAVGNVFLPTEPTARSTVKGAIEAIATLSSSVGASLASSASRSKAEISPYAITPRRSTTASR